MLIWEKEIKKTRRGKTTKESYGVTRSEKKAKSNKKEESKKGKNRLKQ